MTGLIGRKVGMTQFYSAEGNVIPVTVVETGSLRRGAKKTNDDGWLQRAPGRFRRQVRRSGSTKPRRAIWPRPARELSKSCSEFRLDDVSPFEIGQEIKAADLFKVGDRIDVSGISKGHGFSGVIKRWSFAGFPGSHGTHEYFRHGGSIGNRSYPGRVRKGKKMAGHWGNEQVSTQNLEVVDIRSEENLMLVRGAVPGAKQGVVILRPAVKR